MSIEVLADLPFFGPIRDRQVVPGVTLDGEIDPLKLKVRNLLTEDLRICHGKH